MFYLYGGADKLTESRAKDVAKCANAFTENNSRRLAEAVIQVLLSANETIFDRVEGERTLIAKISAALAANKDNDTIVRKRTQLFFEADSSASYSNGKVVLKAGKRYSPIYGFEIPLFYFTICHIFSNAFNSAV